MKEWVFYTNVRFLNDAGETVLVDAFNELGLYRGADRLPVILRETEAGFRLSRAAVAVGRLVRASVSLTVPSITTADVELAAFYRDILDLRGGNSIEPVDLTAPGLATARHYFQARRANKLDSFGRPLDPTFSARVSSFLKRYTAD